MSSGGEGLGQEHPLPAMDHARQDPDDGSRFVRLPINVQRLRQDKRHQVLRPAGRLPLVALMLLFATLGLQGLAPSTPGSLVVCV